MHAPPEYGADPIAGLDPRQPAVIQPGDEVIAIGWDDHGDGISNRGRDPIAVALPAGIPWIAGPGPLLEKLAHEANSVPADGDVWVPNSLSPQLAPGRELIREDQSTCCADREAPPIWPHEPRSL